MVIAVAWIPEPAKRREPGARSVHGELFQEHCRGESGPSPLWGQVGDRAARSWYRASERRDAAAVLPDYAAHSTGLSAEQMRAVDRRAIEVLGRVQPDADGRRAGPPRR
jgi:hypothetical protein